METPKSAVPVPSSVERSESPAVVPHTPSPWYLKHSGYANTPFVIFAGKKSPNFESRFPLTGVTVVAEVPQDESPRHEEQQANARLILAAPSLLKAARLALLEFDRIAYQMKADPAVIDAITVTIEKAEGR